MANDLITWLNPHLPCVRQQELIADLRPHLLNLIREGRIGLSLLIYHHLMRFFTSRRRKSNISPVVPPNLKSV